MPCDASTAVWNYICISANKDVHVEHGHIRGKNNDLW